MKTRKIFSIFAAACLPFLLASCVKDADKGLSWSDGAQLRIQVSTGIDTRLTELPNVDSMAVSSIEGIEYGLNNVGLYVYYKSDYDRGIVTEPYIRNMECTVENGVLIPVTDGTDPNGRNIYIYDEMTLVAFYPYNPDMSLAENHFKVKGDEENYPVTRADYSKQYYIPYRAETTTNPTVAYYTTLNFFPKHTYKIEITVVSDDTGDFPDISTLEILPYIDPVGNDDLDADGKRAAWFDRVWSDDNGGGGSHVRQYIAYIWTDRLGDNSIEKGQVLMQSDKLSLIASQDVRVDEDRVYRYGFNMSTGEIFIPTSSALVHDIPTLKGVGSEYSYYQVCDIDLESAGDWDPINKIGGRFDGGGHKLLNLKVNTFEANGGLFGQIQGNTTLCNINLVEPVITVTNTADTCRVGAICGRVNSELSAEDKLRYLGNLPEGLSDVVREALIKDLLKDILNSQSNVVACRVENPTITVTGLAPRVGTVVGEAGSKNEEGNYRSVIWDSYSLGGSLSVNSGNPDENDGGYTGGFCGLNRGDIIRCFATIEEGSIDFLVERTVTGSDGNPEVITVEAYTGFATMGDYIGISGKRIQDCYSVIADTNTSTMSGTWPADWVDYTSKWPIMNTGWLESPDNKFWYSVGSAPANYPTLQWERR